jgi:hypothetical protein
MKHQFHSNRSSYPTLLAEAVVNCISRGKNICTWRIHNMKNNSFIVLLKNSTKNCMVFGDWHLWQWGDDLCPFCVSDYCIISWYRNWAVVWATRQLGFDSQEGTEVCHVFTASRCSGAHASSCPLCTGTLIPEVRWLELQADHSTASSAKIKYIKNCVSTDQYVFMMWCWIQCRDDLTAVISMIPLQEYFHVKLNRCLYVCL